MLYLAEVTEQIRAIMGSHKTKLKLLASQGNDQMWNPITGEELVTTENVVEATNKGTLYIVNLGTNGQIQGTPELAGKRLVNYLQYFARIFEKTKSQDEEITQWRLSLQLQSEEIANRQVELDNQQERLQELEAELARVEEEKAQLEDEKNKLHEAWIQIREDERQLQENSDSEVVVDTTVFNENYQHCLQAVDNQQASLNKYWSLLEEEKQKIEQQQQTVNYQDNHLQQHRLEVNSILEILQKAKMDLEIQKNSINIKEELLAQINVYLDEIESFKKEVSGLKDDLAGGENEQKIDSNSLENMSVEELESVVNNLRDDTSKLINFVNMQEEELNAHADLIKELEGKLPYSNQADRFNLETELADAKEAMKLLDETLVGQRRNKKKQQKLLNQHITIFYRKKGLFEFENIETIEIEPLLESINLQSDSLKRRQSKLTAEIQNLKQSLNPIQEIIDKENKAYQEQEKRLKQDEENWVQSKIILGQMQCKLNLLEDSLNPLQESLNSVKHYLQNMENAINQLT